MLVAAIIEGVDAVGVVRDFVHGPALFMDGWAIPLSPPEFSHVLDALARRGDVEIVAVSRREIPAGRLPPGAAQVILDIAAPLGIGGVAELPEWDLGPEEAAALRAGADTVRAAAASIDSRQA